MEQLILRLSLQAWRHSHASQLIASGKDVLTIGRRLGHGSPSITLYVYGHLFSSSATKLRPCLTDRSAVCWATEIGLAMRGERFQDAQVPIGGQFMKSCAAGTA